MHQNVKKNSCWTTHTIHLSLVRFLWHSSVQFFFKCDNYILNTGTQIKKRTELLFQPEYSFVVHILTCPHVSRIYMHVHLVYWINFPKTSYVRTYVRTYVFSPDPVNEVLIRTYVRIQPRPRKWGIDNL